jgi:hypothetical protein
MPVPSTWKKRKPQVERFEAFLRLMIFYSKSFLLNQ